WIVAFGELIAPLNLFKMVGSHNQQNLLMAVGAARLAGVGKGVIAQAISEFKGVPHRLELICNVRGIDFINDSKATNYDAAEVGLASVKSPVILVAGGKVKKGDNERWIKQIKKKVSTVLLIGEAAEIFSQELKESGYETYEIVETLENAVKRGLELGQKLKVKVVLFSPACASFDQYQSFEHRGDHFRKLCQELS
ncbi:MAG: glutamate ligase domain-containing protein, partial [cyanobacterium endosymbiont of Rhopalodia inflata]